MNTDASSDKVEEQDQDENDAELEGDEDTEGYRISHRYNDVLQGTYDGEMLASRFDGQGTYTSSQGKYVGSFYNGHFHGDGVLYVTGGKFVGTWENGRMVDGEFYFDDDLAYRKPGQKTWGYCMPTDPRFQREILEGVPRGGTLKYDSVHPEPAAIPPGCYDTLEGYYDPKRNMIHEYSTGNEVRAPDTSERDWIMTHCRIEQ